MRIVGIDLGNTTMGIALSDPSAILATGQPTLYFPEGKFEIPLDYLKTFIDNNKVEIIVVGYPKNMDGSIGFQGKIVEDFVAKVATFTTRQIVLWDERLTTKMANAALLQADLSRAKRKMQVDKVAATVILQSYLDSRK